MTLHRSTITTTNLRRFVLLGAGVTVIALLVGSLLIARNASATPASGLTPIPLASGALTDPVRAKFKMDDGGFGKGLDVNTISVVRYEVAPGGGFGWHQHGGPVWAVIAQGVLTLYGDEPGCVGQEYSAGSAFMDPGDHTHTARNEGDQTLVVYATFMLPAGGAPRIDVPDPGVCPF